MEASAHEKCCGHSTGRVVGSDAAMDAFNISGQGVDSTVEEAPTMRSVSISPAAGFGKPPLLGISRAPQVFKTPPPGISKPAPFSSKSFGVKQEWSGTATPSVWEVKVEDLESVPLDFPLERTHREIYASASVVAKRISNVLRELSIEADYDAHPPKAKCKTSDYVVFRIRLYAGGDNGEPLVVEVQRRCGSASSFMRTCRAILDAAEGKKTQPVSSTTRKVPPFMKPISQMKCLRSEIQKAGSPHNEAAAVLDSVIEMLRSDRLDSNILGLENLCSLTDPVKSSPAVAAHVSKKVLLGNDTSEVREEIRLLLERDVFLPGADDEDGSTKHAEHLRHLALCLFANALDMCSKENCLPDAVKEQKWFAENLIPSLIDEIKLHGDSSCNAHQAAFCLRSLLSCSDLARKTLVNNSGIDALEDAHEFGKARHELLASETRQCLKALEVVPPAT